MMFYQMSILEYNILESQNFQTELLKFNAKDSLTSS
jgi:hypothetical protein